METYTAFQILTDRKLFFQKVGAQSCTNYKRTPHYAYGLFATETAALQSCIYYGLIIITRLNIRVYIIMYNRIILFSNDGRAG